MRSKSVTTRLEPDVYEKLKKLAQDSGITVARYMQYTIEVALQAEVCYVPQVMISNPDNHPYIFKELCLNEDATEAEIGLQGATHAT